jgi:hypothetical protein
VAEGQQLGLYWNEGILMDKPSEAEKFDAVMRKVLSVSKDELKKREKAWRKKRERAKKKRATS